MTNEAIMNAIYEEANKYGFGMSVMEIDNSLESMQKIVGGYIERFALDDEVCIICNEEGK